MRVPHLTLAMACVLVASCGETELPGPVEDPCRGVTCSGHGTCVAGPDGARCECEPAFAAVGLECAASCTPNPCTLPHRTVCSVDGEVVACACDEGYRDDGTGVCVDADPCAPNPCVEPHRSACRVSGGAVVCSCDDGYWDTGECAPALSCTPNPCSATPHKTVCAVDGQAVTCSCEDGYRDDGDGGCEPADPCAPNPCAEPHRTVCRTSGTAAVCSCDDGYWDLGQCVEAVSCTPNPCTAPHRTICAVDGQSVTCGCEQGYRDDGSGNCVLLDPCEPNPCAEPHRTICEATGPTTARCRCEDGYWDLGACVEAVSCDPNPCAAPNKGQCSVAGQAVACACDPGYRDDGAGGCEVDDPCDPSPCSEPYRGRCHVSGSAAICSCDEGYWDVGQCVPAVSCSPNPCTAPHKTRCSIVAQSIACACDAGYRDDGAGNCVVADPCSPNPCNGSHQTVCRASGGTAICSCEAGYRQDPSGACVDACDPNPCAAPNQHVCSPAASGYRCGCDPGYVTNTATGGCQYAPPPDCQYAHAVGDAFEPDECPQLASPAVMNATSLHTIEGAGDVDWVAIEAVDGRAYEISFSAPSLSLDLSVRDATGNRVLAAATSPVNAVRKVALRPGAGRLLVRIAASVPQSNSTGPYSMTIADYADDFGNAAGEAASAQLGSSLSGRLDYTADEDWFWFTALGGHVIELTLSTTGYVEYQLWDALGAADPGSRSPFASGYASGTAARLRWRVTADGTYYVRLRSTSSSSLAAYTLTLRDVGTDDHGDNAAAATALALGSEVGGAMHFSADRDWFSFTPAPGRIYRFTLRASPSVYVRLYDQTALTSSYPTYLYGSGVGALLTFSQKLSSAGPYFLAVERDADSAATYSVLVEESGVDDHGDSAADATPLVAGPPASGRVDFVGDKDWFSLTTTPGRVYTIGVTPTGASLALYGADGKTQISTGSSNPMVFGAWDGGPYYVVVLPNSSSITSYVLTAFESGSDDFGNSAAMASPLAIGAPEAGAIDYAIDADWFSVPLIESHVYRVTVSASGFTAGVKLLAPNGATQLGSFSASGRAELDLRAPTSGVHFVSVAGGYSSGAYLLQVDDLGPDDHGDGAGASTPLSLGTPTPGAIQFSGDVDFFKLPTEARHIYRAMVTPTGLSVRATVLSSDAQTVLANQSSYLPMFTVFRSSASAPYFVSVVSSFAGGMGSYSVRADDLGLDDCGDTQAEATSLVVGAPAISRSIQFAGDVDVYSFSATAGALSLKLIAGGVLGTSLRVAGAGGSPVLASGVGPTTLDLTLPSAGTWYLTVGASVTGAIGDYTIQVAP